MNHWNWASWVWLAWAAAGLSFEVAMLASRRSSNTLSAQVWHLEGTGWTFARYMVAVLLGWLTVHMVFKILR